MARSLEQGGPDEAAQSRRSALRGARRGEEDPAEASALWTRRAGGEEGAPGRRRAPQARGRVAWAEAQRPRPASAPPSGRASGLSRRAARTRQSSPTARATLGQSKGHDQGGLPLPGPGARVRRRRRAAARPVRPRAGPEARATRSKGARAAARCAAARSRCRKRRQQLARGRRCGTRRRAASRRTDDGKAVERRQTRSRHSQRCGRAQRGPRSSGGGSFRGWGRPRAGRSRTPCAATRRRLLLR